MSEGTKPRRFDKEKLLSQIQVGEKSVLNIPVKSVKKVNDTKVPQVYYDAYGESHTIQPGDSKIIDELEDFEL